MRQPFPDRVLASLRGDLVGQVASASAYIDTFLDYNLQPGVARTLLAARREMHRVQPPSLQPSPSLNWRATDGSTSRQ